MWKVICQVFSKKYFTMLPMDAPVPENGTVLATDLNHDDAYQLIELLAKGNQD